MSVMMICALTKKRYLEIIRQVDHLSLVVYCYKIQDEDIEFISVFLLMNYPQWFKCIGRTIEFSHLH